MDFRPTPEQEQLREEVRRFAQAELAPHYLADEAAERLRPRVLEQMIEMGLPGMRIPERHGGGGADFVSVGVAIEEICRAHFGAGYLILLPVLIAEIIAAAANEEQRARFLPPIASGTALPALCLTEPGHGSDATQLTARATPDGTAWRLSGEKTSVSLGMHCSTALVFARTGGEGARGISAFYVELDERHLQRSPFHDLGSRSIGRAALFFEDHPAPADALIGQKGEGFVRVMQGFDFSRALISLMCLGAADACLEEALAHARERHSMGRPIGAWQGVSFPLVEHVTYVRAARLLSYEALWRKDEGLPHTLESNLAKWWGPKASADAAHQALLTLGHTGYSTEVAHGQRLRDIIGLEIGDGTAQIAKLVAARQLLGREFAP